MGTSFENISGNGCKKYRIITVQKLLYKSNIATQVYNNVAKMCSNHTIATIQSFKSVENGIKNPRKTNFTKKNLSNLLNLSSKV